MRRALTLTVLATLAITARAQAIEMFTNFNNGQNIGFPPLEVPTRIYGGFGRGGWNPHAIGMPLKTNPPVPAMMPTGQIPGRRAFDYYGPAPGVMVGNDGINSQRQTVSDRRRGRWQRGGATELRNDVVNGAKVDSARASDNSEASRRSTSADVEPLDHSMSAIQPLPTILHAQPDNFSSGASPRESENGRADFQDWPKADALFPH